MRTNGYKIVNVISQKEIPMAAAQFRYKGHVISMSTASRFPLEVMVCPDEVPDAMTMCNSVEEAIAFVDGL